VEPVTLMNPQTRHELAVELGRAFAPVEEAKRAFCNALTLTAKNDALERLVEELHHGRRKAIEILKRMEALR
jgi:hypothetical protein